MFGGDSQDNGHNTEDNNGSSEEQHTDAPMLDTGTPPQDDQQSTSTGSDSTASAAPQSSSDDMLSNDHAVNDDLINLKQQALQQLSPLVGHLDQSPEEKFRTTMMMIQASDNSALLKNAFDAANAIPDDKAKAQALLDVINEINYFTQHHDEQ